MSIASPSTPPASASPAPPAARPMVAVEHLSKRFRLYHERHQTVKQALLRRNRGTHEDFEALSDVSFEVFPGETFGIIGHNGSGKSTLLKCLTEILQPDDGSVQVNGTVSALLELGAGFHPELSGRENVYLNAAILGVSRKQIAERFDDIVSFAGLEQFIDTPVKNYSSGMFVRLGFAVAVNVDPDVLIIDEVLAVGDAEFQARCGDKIADFRDRGKTIILVTHSMSDVIRVCHRALWLDHGKVRMIGKPEDLADAYLDTTHSGRAVSFGDDMRWGSGEVVVDAVRVTDDAGAPIEFARTGEPLRIEVDLASSQPIESPELMLSFYDRDSNLVTIVSTRSRGVDIDVVDGRRTVTLRIDSLPLLEGTYETTFSVLDGTGQREFDVRSRFMTFDVMKGDTNDGGIITLPASWKL